MTKPLGSGAGETRRRWGLLPLLGAVLLSACGPDDTPRPPVGGVDAVAADPAEAVDWASRTVTLEVPGWTVEFCGGDAPFLCISRGGAQLGSIELLAWPISDYAVMREVLQRGGSEQEAMEAAAADLHATVGADRKVGISGSYELRVDPLARLPVGGGEGVRSGFLGSLDGRPLERVVQYRRIEGDSLYLLSANASAGAGPREGDFPLEEMDELVPLLDRIAAASRFTAPGS